MDCFFDDIWCFLSCLVDLKDAPSFRRPRLESWMPVDRFHSGFDTVAYLHLHRFVAAALHDAGEFAFEEPIAGHIGHEMVLREGRKMSKHLGNVVSPSAVMRRHGVDTLRVAMLWAAAPHTAVEWRAQLLERAESLLGGLHRLYSLAAGHPALAADEPAPPSRTMAALHSKVGDSLKAIGRFVDEYRPNAAVEELASMFRQTEDFVLHRLPSARLLPCDAAPLREVLQGQCVALSLFAPHLAEELWHGMGRDSYVVQQPWPALADARQATAHVAAPSS
jgi:leucyl-tRNA synthetase